MGVSKTTTEPDRAPARLTTWHTEQVDHVLATTASRREGLTGDEARARLAEHGPNVLTEAPAKSPWRMLWDQFSETMVVILIVAGLTSAVLGKIVESIAIFAIVLLFAVLGFVQEYRAERAIAALKRMSRPFVRVRRDGTLQEIASSDLVRGDIVLVEAGSVLPADVRFIETANLRVQESALTGESVPVDKDAATVSAAETSLGDRHGMGYMGTVVTYGRGAAVVVETGMRTELGRIAELMQSVATEETPLQRRLDRLGKTLAVAGFLAAGLVFLIGLLRGEKLGDMFLTGVSVAVAVVPEGLPAVVTITLALGAQRMLKRRALIRKLPAVETLGSVTVICSDKTGTLTENVMKVTVVDVAGRRLDLAGDEAKAGKIEAGPIDLVLLLGTLCNDATLAAQPDEKGVRTIGDPTEGALLIAAAQAGHTRADLEATLPRVAELPFDSSRKRMTTVHRTPTGSQMPVTLRTLPPTPYLAMTKGAVDGLVGRSGHVLVGDHTEPLTPSWVDRIRKAGDELASGGMRVLAFCYRPLQAVPAMTETDLETGLVFVGLVGMMDPPRESVAPSVSLCVAAGIRPVMITGDHPLTAMTIARSLGIPNAAEAITGDALNRMSDGDLDGAVDTTSVYARVAPEDKLRIVAALQRKGHIVAMTGDGVNDAPALKKADIGVAMGITGTDASKEAADMVLLDDNFSTIVAAVEEGRVICDNLIRFIQFSLAGNLGKVLLMLGAPLLGITIALRPLQLLWLNLLTDGLMGLGLGVEAAEKTAMSRPPRRPDAPILGRVALLEVTWMGVLIVAISMLFVAIYHDPQIPADMTWQTMVFAGIGFMQMGQAMGLRATGQFVFAFPRNPLMGVIMPATLLLQVGVIYVPGINTFFGLVPLAASDLAVAGLSGVATFLATRLTRRK